MFTYYIFALGSFCIYFNFTIKVSKIVDPLNLTAEAGYLQTFAASPQQPSKTIVIKKAC